MKTNKSIYNNIFSAKALFFSGLVIMPALLFNPSTEYRFLQFIFFWFLLLLTGKKTRPFFTLITILFIMTFNLIIPYGQVLFSAGPVKITSGALKSGLHRAVTFMGLIMLSKASIRQDLRMPGAFGELLGESLRLFSVMMGKNYRLKMKNPVKAIDTLLMELSEEDLSETAEEPQRTKPAGYIILAIVIFISWLPRLNIVPKLGFFAF